MPLIKKVYIMTPDELEGEFGKTLLAQAREAVECADRLIPLYWARWTNTAIAEELNYSVISISLYLKALKSVTPILIPNRTWLSDHFLTENDLAKTKLGILCNRKHDFEHTGQSLRLTRPSSTGRRRGSGDCLICSRVAARKRDRSNADNRKSPYRSSARPSVDSIEPTPFLSFSVSSSSTFPMSIATRDFR